MYNIKLVSRIQSEITSHVRIATKQPINEGEKLVLRNKPKNGRNNR